MGGKRRQYSIEDRVLIRELAGKGLTNEQIALYLGVSVAQWYVHKKDDPSIQELLDTGRSHALAEITNALYQSALGGNVTAQIFYLKNRAPSEWRDRRENIHTGADGGPIQLTDMERTAKLAELLNAARERAAGQTPH